MEGDTFNKFLLIFLFSLLILHEIRDFPALIAAFFDLHWISETNCFLSVHNSPDHTGIAPLSDVGCLPLRSGGCGFRITGGRKSRHWGNAAVLSCICRRGARPPQPLGQKSQTSGISCQRRVPTFQIVQIEL
jgi:hypothetical protein